MTAVEAGDIALEWGLKSSFLAYVSVLPDGRIAVEAPAERDGALFRLPGRRISAGKYRFDGALRFFGHAGVLDVVLEDIGLEFDGESRERAQIMTTVSGYRMALADLTDPEANAVGFTTYRSVALTDDGAAVLGGVYPPGVVADPVTIRTA